jgi:hypothetical protein
VQVAPVVPAPANEPINQTTTTTTTTNQSQRSNPAPNLSALQISRNYLPTAPKDSPAWKTLTDLGFSNIREGGDDLNPHAASAEIRDIATVRALARLYDAGARHVLDVYGSPRTLSAAAFLNRKLSQPLKVSLYRPIITSKDVSRFPLDPTSVVGENSPLPDDIDGFLFVDVYTHTLRGEISLLAKDLIRNYPNRMASSLVMWVGRCFYGDAGLCQEAVWYRDYEENGLPLIYFSQDAQTRESYVHPACDWLWNSTAWPTISIDATPVHLSWNIVDVLGKDRTSLHIISFSCTSYPPVAPRPLRFEENLLTLEAPKVSSIPIIGGLITSVQSACYNSFSKYLSPALRVKLAPQVPTVLYKPFVQEMVNKYASVKIRSYNVGRIHADLCALLNTPRYKDLQERMPIAFPSDTFQASMAILHHRLEEKTANALAWRESSGHVAATYNEVTGQAMGEAPPVASSTSLPSWMVIAGAGCLFAAYMYFKPKPRVALASIYSSEVLMFPLVISPIFEEAAKRVLDCFSVGFLGYQMKLGALFGPLEWLAKIALADEYGFSKSVVAMRAFPAMVLHEKLRHIPWWKAVILHSVFNAIMLFAYRPLLEMIDPKLPGPFLPFESAACFPRWKNLCYLAPWPERAYEVVSSTSIEQFESRDSAFPTSIEVFAPKPEPDTHLICSGVPPFRSERNQTYFYQFLPTQIPGYVPACTDANLMAAVEYRILAAPPLSPELQEDAWKRAFKKIPLSQWPRISWEEEKNTWLDHFEPAKRKKYAALLSQLNRNSWHAYAHKTLQTPVFMKSNEMLFRIENGFFQLKPRVIINVAPEVQTLVGPSIWRAQQNLKREWPMEPLFRDRGFTNVSFSYAGAATDVDLSRWMELVEANVGDFAAIVVSGDDSLVYISLNGERYCFEGDASMYDQSQSVGPLTVGWRAYKRLGVDSETIKLLRALAYNKYVVEGRDRSNLPTFYTIDKRHRPMRDTGGADTSLGNSVLMALAWYHVLRSTRSVQYAETSVLEEFSKLGFKMKLKRLPSTQATFLKGMWYHTTSGLFWGPLPSRFLKMGKTLKDPRIIYKTKDLNLAAQLFLNDIALCYDVFLAVPIIRQFCKNFKRGIMVVNYIETHQIQAASKPKPCLSPEAFEQLEIRYGITQKEFESFEAILPSSPFWFIQSPIFDKMAAVDC